MVSKKLSDFFKIHNNSNIVVCGCGTSLKSFKQYASDFITIGVNDVPALFEPDYLLVSDYPVRFNRSRRNLINNSKSKYLFTCATGWSHHNMVKCDLGKKGYSDLDNPDRINFFLNSPYIAINLAYKMGAKNIGLIGVDFTDGHFYNPKDGQHDLVNRHLGEVIQSYKKIHDVLKLKGVNLYNLSDISKVNTVPYIKIDDFNKL